jgi:hypothetical protein
LATENKDKKENAPQIYDKHGQDQHIFRNKENHLQDTPENRELLTNLVKDPKNLLNSDSHGNEWYGKILDNGKQVWAVVKNNMIRNGGINNEPRTFNPKTGLCRINKK